MEKKKSGSERLALLDSLRGLTLISMILYHACWDAVYLLGANWPWYGSRAAYIWQQSICWTFIMLSGFRFLHSFLVQASEAGTGSLRGGSSCDGCYMYFAAGGQGGFWSTDLDRILYAADGPPEKAA